MPEGATTSYIKCDVYHYFAGQALLMTSQSRPQTEYVISTDNIIGLDFYFNLTKKSNTIDRLQYDLIQILLIWYWLTILGHPICFFANFSL